MFLAFNFARKSLKKKKTPFLRFSGQLTKQGQNKPRKNEKTADVLKGNFLSNNSLKNELKTEIF